MDEPLLTERDKKAIEFSARHPFLARRAVWVLPVVFLIVAVAQLYVASQLADPAGLTLIDAVRLWFSGIEPGGTYSGLAGC